MGNSPVSLSGASGKSHGRLVDDVNFLDGKRVEGIAAGTLDEPDDSCRRIGGVESPPQPGQSRINSGSLEGSGFSLSRLKP